MLVPLLPADGATPATWAMVELQGEIDRRDGGSESQALDVGVITTSSNASCCRVCTLRAALLAHMFRL